MALVSKKESAIIWIDEEEYSILSEPSASSALVAAETKSLQGSLDLQQLVTELSQVGGFIHIAYNAIAAAGPDPKIMKLQITIQTLGSEIADLCGKSVVTVSNFKSTTRTILQELQSAYEYLLDGFEDMAASTLADLSTLAQKMADAAETLQIEFEGEGEKVQKALHDTMETENWDENQKVEIEKKNKELEKKQEDLEKTIVELEEDEKEAKKERQELQLKEEQLAESSLASMGQMFTAADPLEFVARAAAMPVMMAKTVITGIGALYYGQKAKEKLEKEKNYRRERQKSLREKTEFLCQMQDNKKMEGDYKAAIGFLHEACGSLKELSVVMKRAAIFWRQLHDHCQSLAEDGIKNKIEKAMKFDDLKRLKFFTSTPFKRQAVCYYAKWVALHVTCSEYMGHIKATQEELFRFIKENPTREESQKRLPELIAQYTKVLEKEQQRMKECDAIADEKIKMIEENTKENSQ